MMSMINFDFRIRSYISYVLHLIGNRKVCNYFFIYAYFNNLFEWIDCKSVPEPYAIWRNSIKQNIIFITRRMMDSLMYIYSCHVSFDRPSIYMLLIDFTFISYASHMRLNTIRKQIVVWFSFIEQFIFHYLDDNIHIYDLWMGLHVHYVHIELYLHAIIWLYVPMVNLIFENEEKLFTHFHTFVSFVYFVFLPHSIFNILILPHFPS